MTKYFILLFFAIMNIHSYAAWQGDGTVGYPYRIYTRPDMETLADSVNSGVTWGQTTYFSLMNDITDSVRTVIGTNYEFNHHFDGGGHKITISMSTVNWNWLSVGLFGETGENSVIENLNVDGRFDIIGGPLRRGCIVGRNRGLVQNCNNYTSMQTTITGTYFIGGIAGENSIGGAIINCNNFATSMQFEVSTSYSIGGIVGWNFGLVYNCSNYGSPIQLIGKPSNSSYIGGIVGTNFSQGIVSKCMNTSDIFFDGGGIAGGNAGIIDNCINMSNITITVPLSNGVNQIGGIVSLTSGESFILNNINLGNVDCIVCAGSLGGGRNGGIAGVAFGGAFPVISAPTVSNNASYGFVKGINRVGGIIGDVFNQYVNVFNNFNSGVVIGVSETGCIVGRNNGGNISNNHYDKQMCGEED